MRGPDGMQEALFTMINLEELRAGQKRSLLPTVISS